MWLQTGVLAVKLLDLHSIEVWHVVVLEDIEHSLHCLVKYVSLDLALLELLDLRCSQFVSIFWHNLHVIVASFDCFELFIDDQTGDFFSEGQSFILADGHTR